MKITYRNKYTFVVPMSAKRTLSLSEKVALLQKTDLFRGLDEELLNKIASLAVFQSLNRGQVLFSEHEEASALYVVATGELRSVRESPHGREQVFSTEGAGSVLALAPLFEHRTFYSTVIANTSSTVLSIEKQAIHELCREHSEILWNVAQVLAHKLRDLADVTAMLALRNVEQRVAECLVTIAREKGVRVGKEGAIFELTLTRTDIAIRVGSVREVVSRALTQLHQSGMIRMEGRRLVTVPNVKLLADFAGARHEKDTSELVQALSSDIA